MSKRAVWTATLVALVGAVVVAWTLIALRESAWDALVRRAFCRYAQIVSLEEPLRCMQTGDAPVAQCDAFAALTRASGCTPVGFDCWERLFRRERDVHGYKSARDALRFLLGWCAPDARPVRGI